jgi:hypothetical protein
MKIITSLVDTPLPMPNGRVLPAKGKLRVPDHVAAGERVRSWGLNVLVEDYVPPTAEEPKAEPEAPKGGKARLSDRQAVGDEKA